MKEVMILNELEQIKTVSNMYRIEVIESFGGKQATAKTISDKMGEPHAKVNYHIKELLNVGILELVEEKVRLGIVEKFYRPSAKVFIIDKSILIKDGESIDGFLCGEHICAFDGIAKDFYNAIEKSEAVNNGESLIHKRECYLTAEEVDLLQGRLEASIEEFVNGRKDRGYCELKHYSVSTLVVPK
jgi:hypothetical protein